jgi:hypothetical protein
MGTGCEAMPSARINNVASVASATAWHSVAQSLATTTSICIDFKT